MTLPAGLSTSDFYYILPEIVLTAGALLLLVADILLPRGSRALTWVAMAVLAATALALVPFTSTHVEVSRGLIAVDQFALFFKAIFLIAAMMTVLMSSRYLEVEGVRPGEYYFLILCSTLGMMIMAGAIDLITAFIGLETMAIAFYILAGFIKPKPAIERGGGQVFPARCIFARDSALRNVDPVRALRHHEPPGDGADIHRAGPATYVSCLPSS